MLQLQKQDSTFLDFIFNLALLCQQRRMRLANSKNEDVPKSLLPAISTDAEKTSLITEQIVLVRSTRIYRLREASAARTEPLGFPNGISCTRSVGGEVPLARINYTDCYSTLSNP